jgi:hypothetical protein
VQTNVHVENQLMRVHCHAGDLAGAVAILQVRQEALCTRYYPRSSKPTTKLHIHCQQAVAFCRSAP